MTKVLVTGAPGWLGNNLVEELIRKKHKVRCIVLKGQDVSFLKKIGVEIFEADITDKNSLKNSAKGIDVVIHCAGIIHPKRIKDLYNINYEGTKNLLDEAIGSKVKRFVYVSSNSPLGTNKNRNVLMKEDDPYRPYKNYGKSKMLSEMYVNDMFKKNLIETVIVRPCWFYGEGQPARQTTFFKMIKKGNPIIFGNGKNLRSMCYIGNLVHGLILAATIKKASGQIYWIADEKPYSTIEIYQTIADLFGSKLKPFYIPGIVSEILQFLDTIVQSTGFYNQEIHVGGEMNKDIACSIDKAKKELGYDPKVNLKEGMKDLLRGVKKIIYYKPYFSN